MNSVIVVGGGAIGLLTAYELNKSGLEVTLIERQQFGQESSWAGGGIVSPLFPWRYPDAITELSRISQQLYPDMLKEMHQVTGLDAEFLPSGMLVLGNYEAENPQQWAQNLNINMQTIGEQDVRQLAPEASNHFQQGYWFPEVHQVRNPRLLAVIMAYLQQTDIRLINNQPVIEILTDKNRATGVRTETRSYQADCVVIAGGAWTSSILNGYSVDTKIKPVKGQMLLLKGEPDTVNHITLSEDRYIIPRKDGRVLIGSTTEDVGFDKSTSHTVRQQLLDYAIRTIPHLKDYAIEHHWSGLRPCSSNGIPIIGPHPTIQQLYLNSGHYRNGLVMAPASAQLLTQVITKKPTSLEPKIYNSCDSHHTQNPVIDRSSLQT